MRNCFYLFVVLVVASCVQQGDFDKDYLSAYESWKKERDESMRAKDGFANLAGLFWLKEGENTVGSDKQNSIIFPKAAAAKVGTLILNDSIVIFECASDIAVSIDSFCVSAGIVYDKTNQIATKQQHGNFEWFIIERSGNFGIRLRDFDHPLTKQPLDIKTYPLQKNKIVEAKYIAFEAPKVIEIENILGFKSKEEMAGALEFEIDGKKQRLLPIFGDEGMFVMFGDATNGNETYGGGRYLATELPDENGNVVLDFNRAYNPPCVFTDFATCPKPPAENILEIPIEAGEKSWH